MAPGAFWTNPGNPYAGAASPYSGDHHTDPRDLSDHAPWMSAPGFERSQGGLIAIESYSAQSGAKETNSAVVQAVAPRGSSARDDSPGVLNLPGSIPGALALSPQAIDVRAEGRPVITAGADTIAHSVSLLDRKDAAGVNVKVLGVNSPAAVAEPNTERTQPESTVTAAEVPAPQSAGLIAEVLPIDRGALEDAVDRFLLSLDDLGSDPLGWEVKESRIPVSVGLMLAGTALEVTRRRLKRKSEGAKPPRERSPERLGLFGFPELPGPWSMRVT